MAQLRLTLTLLLNLALPLRSFKLLAFGLKSSTGFFVFFVLLDLSHALIVLLFFQLLLISFLFGFEPRLFRL